MDTSLEWKDKPVKYLRDNAVEQLQWHFAKNHLEFDEFEQRVTIALSTQSKAELASLTADLPAREDTKKPNREVDLAVYRDTQPILSILSETKRTGIWVPPKHLRVTTVLSETELDFRDVQLQHNVTYISLGCCLGEVKIIVPPGINVVSQVRCVLGSVENKSRGKMQPDAPTLVFEGKVILGQATITVRE